MLQVYFLLWACFPWKNMAIVLLSLPKFRENSLLNYFVSANLGVLLNFPLHFQLATCMLLFSFCGQLSISLTPSTTLCLSFAQLLWGWTSCKAHRRSRFQPFASHSLCICVCMCVCVSCKWRILTHLLIEWIKYRRLLNQQSVWATSTVEIKANALFWCSWNIWAVAVPLHFPPDFTREKWTQTVIGSLFFLYTCRLCQLYNCVIQVVHQPYERSSRAVAGGMKTVQPNRCA